MRYGRQAAGLVALGLVGFVIDRGLKALALAGQTFGPADGGVRFELFPNPDIGFSLRFPAAASLLLIPMALMAFVWLGWRWWRRGDLVRSAATMVIIMSAVSNYLDRLRHGYVVDYVSLGTWFPVFNLSDVVIVCGLVLMAVAAKRKLGS
ncbi:MAG: signal peptidase II [Candidatus Kerfeldbacteria bacterium]|nr:signal peptidase II [Candidatus Kerfeldbacteria bacterium]